MHASSVLMSAKQSIVYSVDRVIDFIFKKTVRGAVRENGTGAVRAKRYGGGRGKTVRGRYGQNGTGAVGAGKG